MPNSQWASSAFGAGSAREVGMMAKVVHPRHAPSIAVDLRGAQERADRVSEPCAGIGGPRRVWC
jgi:hypothetical protein